MSISFDNFASIAVTRRPEEGGHFVFDAIESKLSTKRFPISQPPLLPLLLSQRRLSPQQPSKKTGQIASEKDFEEVKASADVVVVDFMARWCRKCIYVKPRIATLLKDKFPQVPLAFVDVNAVPSGVVSGAGVTKMPTVVLYVRGEILESYVAGESATAAVLRVEEMVKRGLEEAKKNKGKKEKAEA